MTWLGDTNGHRRAAPKAKRGSGTPKGWRGESRRHSIAARKGWRLKGKELRTRVKTRSSAYTHKFKVYPKNPKFSEVKPGMVFRVKSKQFGKTKYIRVVPKDSPNPNVFYAIFVDPNDFSKKRMGSDRVMAIWDFDYSGKYGDRYIRVR